MKLVSRNIIVVVNVFRNFVSMGTGTFFGKNVKCKHMQCAQAHLMCNDKHIDKVLLRSSVHSEADMSEDEDDVINHAAEMVEGGGIDDADDAWESSDSAPSENDVDHFSEETVEKHEETDAAGMGVQSLQPHVQMDADGAGAIEEEAALLKRPAKRAREDKLCAGVTYGKRFCSKGPWTLSCYHHEDCSFSVTWCQHAKNSTTIPKK